MSLFDTCYQLFQIFVQRAKDLCSDGTVVEKGTVQVSKTSGATLTSAKTKAALKIREERSMKRAKRNRKSRNDSIRSVCKTA